MFLPTNSITKTKLVIMVPPVANAAKNLMIKNPENHGEKAAPKPEQACNITAITKGFLRPYLEADIL